jgi:Isoprenylcysteine carboxyl methyltransferase (ICMT) family
MEAFSRAIDRLQSLLNFERIQLFKGNAQFTSTQGNGRMGLTGFLLGFIGGVHLNMACISVLCLAFILPASTTTVVAWGVGGVSWSVYALRVLVLWSTYIGLLACFHFGEFLVTAIHQPSALSYESYVVNHSKAYTVAALASWTEFWVEVLIFKGYKWKFNIILLLAGLILVLGGQAIRSIAMWQCGKNFAHRIMEEKTADHMLVTTGIYPTLVGFGGQLERKCCWSTLYVLRRMPTRPGLFLRKGYLTKSVCY